jgi:oligosaccharide repeat unit polymerase
MRNWAINILISIIYLITFFAFFFAVYAIYKVGISNISNNQLLRQVVSELGPFAIVLMFPIGVTTYHWLLFIDGKRRNFNVYKLIIFSSMSLIVGLVSGQRTNLALIVILPLLYLFIKKRKIKVLFVAAIILIGLSAIYLMYFKVTTKYLSLNIMQSLMKILVVDFDRNWSFWAAISAAKVFDNEIMLQMGQGYIYTLFTFIPRGLFEMKGYSSETWFVFYMGNYFVPEWKVDSLKNINWGLTMSGISESMINFGYLGIGFYSALIGSLLRWMSTNIKSNRYFYSCFPLISMLFSGYTMFNILIIYLPILLIIHLFYLREKIKSEIDEIAK